MEAALQSALQKELAARPEFGAAFLDLLSLVKPNAAANVESQPQDPR